MREPTWLCYDLRSMAAARPFSEVDSVAWARRVDNIRTNEDYEVDLDLPRLLQYRYIGDGSNRPMLYVREDMLNGR
jgi:hypothetical protein